MKINIYIVEMIICNTSLVIDWRRFEAQCKNNSSIIGYELLATSPSGWDPLRIRNGIGYSHYLLRLIDGDTLVQERGTIVGYLHNLARGVLYRGRQYRMGCSSLITDQEVDRRVCRRFFNSFRIVGPPQ